MLGSFRGFKQLTIFTERCIFDVWRGSDWLRLRCLFLLGSEYDFICSWAPLVNFEQPLLQKTTWRVRNALRKQFLEKLCITHVLFTLCCVFLIFGALWSRVQKQLTALLFAILSQKIYCNHFWRGSWVPLWIFLSLGCICCDMTTSTSSYKKHIPPV